MRYQTQGQQVTPLTVISCSQMGQVSVESSEHWVRGTGRPLLPSTIVQSQYFVVVVLLFYLVSYYVKKVKPNLEDLLIYEFNQR